MKKPTTLAIRLPEETKAALEKAAAEDMRATSQLAEKILTDWLRAKEYLTREYLK